jgi:transcriptional regulator with XRE-family HTH domain
MSFGELLERKFLEWQTQKGKRKSLEDFAAYLGVSQPLISQWMNGRRRPGPENIKMLAILWGPEVYDSLGLPRPNLRHAYVSRHWERLPIKEQMKITEIIARYTTEPVPAADEPERRAAKT